MSKFNHKLYYNLLVFIWYIVINIFLLFFCQEYQDYETGIKYVKRAEETSNVDSEVDATARRSRKKPIRFQNDSDDGHDDDGM